MKTKLSLLSVVFCFVIFTACKKNNPKELFRCNFDDGSDLALWSEISSGSMVLEDGGAKLSSITTCFGIETNDLINVKKGVSYTLKFRFKMNTLTQKTPQDCVGFFFVRVEQGNEQPLFKTMNEAVDWTDKIFSFESVSTAQIRINFSSGTSNGALIDNVVLIEDAK